MANIIQQLEDLKEWGQDPERYARRLEFRHKSGAPGMEVLPQEFDELSDREVEYYRKPPFSTREEYRKGQLVQPGPEGVRQGFQGKSHAIYEPGSNNKKLKTEVLEDITEMMSDAEKFPDKQTITKTFKYKGNPDKVLKMWANETGNTIPKGRFRLHTYEGTDIQKNLVKAFEAQGDNQNIMKLAREYFPEMYKKKKTNATQQVRRILTEFADYVPRPNEPLPPGEIGTTQRRRKKINLALKRMGDTTIGEQMADQIWKENQKWIKLANENPEAILKNKKLRYALTRTVDVDTGEIKKRILTDDEILERVKRGDLFTEEHITEVRQVETAPKKGGGTKLIKGHAVEYPINKQSVTTFWNQSFLPNARKYIRENPDGKNVKAIVKILDDYGLKLQIGDKTYGSTVEKVAWNSKKNISPRLQSNFDIFSDRTIPKFKPKISGGAALHSFPANIPAMWKRLGHGTKRILGWGSALLFEGAFMKWDYDNELSKGKTHDEAVAIAKNNASFGIIPNKKYLPELKKVAEDMGIDSRAFEKVYFLNEKMAKVQKEDAQYQQKIEMIEKMPGDPKRKAKALADMKAAYSNWQKGMTSQVEKWSEDVAGQIAISKTKLPKPSLDQIAEERYNITDEDWQRPFAEIQMVGEEKLRREKKRAFPVQSKLADPESGEKYKWITNWFTPTESFLDRRTTGQEKQRLIDDMVEKGGPGELYRYNIARGLDPDSPVTKEALENLQYEQPGLGLGMAGGGIANVRRPNAIPPVSGPMPQGGGLSTMFNRVKPW